MTPHFARHEQFLRIFTLLEILSTARQPLGDDALIDLLRDRLGLARLSVRTLHRDCEFLTSCGYPLDHGPLPEGRKFGWMLTKDAGPGRRVPAEPITLLELVAFMVARDLLRTCEGTVLWTGIESLRHKIEQALPATLRDHLDKAQNVFHVAAAAPGRYATRPRLISTLSTAITDCREIDVASRSANGQPTTWRLRPLRLVIDPPSVQLLGIDANGGGGGHVFIDIDRIDTVQPLDVTFSPPAIDVERILAGRAP
jgi:predicted DNA-binding transcriptional regulator YafY